MLQSHIFNIANMYLNATCKNKILAKRSEFTVYDAASGLISALLQWLESHLFV